MTDIKNRDLSLAVCAEGVKFHFVTLKLVMV